MAHQAPDANRPPDPHTCPSCHAGDGAFAAAVQRGRVHFRCLHCGATWDIPDRRQHASADRPLPARFEHELMNLLVIVEGHAELLRDIVPPDRHEDLAAIMDACDRITRLTRTWGS